MSDKPTKIRKTGKIRNKLLLYIVPIVVIMIIILIAIASTMSKKRMTELATSNLNSSISNQADNIVAWLNKNLEYFSTAKQSIEAANPDEAQLQTILDGFYGYNSDSPEGLRIGTADGAYYKATESTLEEANPTESTWYKQGLSRVNLQYGTSYTNSQGKDVISASGILNMGDESIKVIAADVTLDKITIIVNSGVKMDKASSFLVDTNDNTILAHRDTALVSTKIAEDNGDVLLANVAKAINAENYTTKQIGNYVVAFKTITGTDWVLVSYIEQDVIMASIKELVNYLVIAGLIATILIIILILYVVSRVIAPLAGITKSINAMSEGDFTIDVKAESNDEIGAMGGKIAEFVESMRHMLSSISEESEKLKAESEASDSVSRSMFDASQSQAEAMQQLNDTVDQLALAVGDIANNATTLAAVVADTRDNSVKADESMKETVKISQKGREDMEKLSHAMDGIQTANTKLVDSINEVGKASEEITNIVSMIGEIAEETNLLSLNASIEAARAGEAGKGFAVVATQIGKLAQTSSESATNISNLIEEVHRLIDEAVGQANASADSIEENSELIHVAVETFDQIYENIQASNDCIEEMIRDVEKVDDVATNVAAIAEEQAASADEILATSENMVVEAKNISKHSEDVANNSHELADTSDTLTSHVQKFKI
ncbi:MULTISPECIES: methyl-accepting chemotaxis protein [unclassified Butyrivibrio]|uniref:methyl-accepting chemotaxis protein n=1 Tax=unclassified Butyrivibrio TaxID=2639466 RepID=UPI0003B53897|nr:MULTISPECIES: methyl-accepting chemotaxis protein [unclassified Butyrivibrio]